MEPVKREERTTTDQIARQKYAMHADFCKALGNPARHEVLHLLLEGCQTVTEIEERSGFSKANISQHLSHLTRVGLLRSTRRGLNILFEVKYPQIAKACEMIDEIYADEMENNLKIIEKG